MARVVAVSNQKGGVAKTTTCLSLGACLAELGRRTLVVDLDSQAHLTMAVGLDPDELEWTLADLLGPADAGTPADSAPANGEMIQPTMVEGLDILPADVRLASIERFLYEQDGYEASLARVLAPWQAGYEYILLDCPPSLSALTLTALTAARRVLIPVQCEYFAARGLDRLLGIVAAVQERTNPDLTYHLLATMYDQRNNICQSVLEQLQAHFADHLLDTVIGVDTHLRECPVAGEPITVYAPRTRATEQYRQLAREFHTKIEKGWLPSSSAFHVKS
jgi:chromosome partitioning protein